MRKVRKASYRAKPELSCRENSGSRFRIDWQRGWSAGGDERCRDINVRFEVVAASSDVIVVGAGVIGCAIGFELARRGASVQILDSRPAGMGATQASAGVLAPYIEARENGPLLDLIARSLELFDDFVGEATSVSGLTVEYRRNGTLDVATVDRSMEQLAAAAQGLRSRGIEAHLLDASQLRG